MMKKKKTTILETYIPGLGFEIFDMAREIEILDKFIINAQSWCPTILLQKVSDMRKDLRDMVIEALQTESKVSADIIISAEIEEGAQQIKDQLDETISITDKDKIKKQSEDDANNQDADKSAQQAAKAKAEQELKDKEQEEENLKKGKEGDKENED